MMASDESKLNGVNAPGSQHTWIIGDYSLSEKVARLYTEGKQTYKEIARKLGANESVVARRIRHLARDGEVKFKMPQHAGHHRRRADG